MFAPSTTISPPAAPALSNHTTTASSSSPSSSNQSPDPRDDNVEMMSPNVPNNGGQWTYEEQFKQVSNAL